VAERERVLQVLNNFGFALQLGRAVGILLDGFRVDRLTHERTEKKMIGEADVLHLFGESADAFELAAGRRERILLFRHGLGGGDHFLLDNAIVHVEDRGDRRRLLLGRCAALRAEGWRRGGGAQQNERHDDVLHRMLQS
jgi:hypothetical protein